MSCPRCGRALPGPPRPSESILDGLSTPSGVEGVPGGSVLDVPLPLTDTWKAFISAHGDGEIPTRGSNLQVGGQVGITVALETLLGIPTGAASRGAVFKATKSILLVESASGQPSSKRIGKSETWTIELSETYRPLAGQAWSFMRVQVSTGAPWPGSTPRGIRWGLRTGSGTGNPIVGGTFAIWDGSTISSAVVDGAQFAVVPNRRTQADTPTKNVGSGELRSRMFPVVPGVEQNFHLDVASTGEMNQNEPNLDFTFELWGLIHPWAYVG